MKDTARARLHLDPGTVIGARSLRSIEGNTVAIPDAKAPGGAELEWVDLIGRHPERCAAA